METKVSCTIRMRFTMNNWAALAFVFVVSSAIAGTAQGQEFSRVLRNGERATLSVFGPRPVDLAAKKLAASGRRVMVPRAALLEMLLDLRADGSLSDVRKVVRDLAETANRLLPFGYRIVDDRDVFTLVATRTRDEQGQSVELTPILDRKVAIPLGTRRIVEHINLLTESLQRQTGVRVSCCQAAVGGVPWGSTVVSLEARDEPARSVLLRLLRSEPGRDRLVRNEQGGAYHVVKSEPGRVHWHWTMRCQPGDAWCFVNVAAIPEKP